jgi:hypothetical protein
VHHHVYGVYYEMKNEEYHKDDDHSKSNQPPPDLPNDEGPLLDFFDKRTKKAGMLDLGIARKYKTLTTAVVEYFPHECECHIWDFNGMEESHTWSMKEMEIHLKILKIQCN